jgi:hemolysin activation/secretion protein
MRALRHIAGCIAIALGFAGGLRAQTAAPNIGTTLREMEQQRPAVPPAPTHPLDIEQPKAAAVESGPETQFTVAKIRVTGSTAYPASRLEALVSEFTGRSESLAQLRKAADTITHPRLSARAGLRSIAEDPR